MSIHTVECQFGPHDHRTLVIRREPWWSYATAAVIDRICAATCHRWCNSTLMHWAIRLSDQHSDRFTFPADHDRLVAYNQWRHPHRDTGGNTDLDVLDGED